MSARPDGLGLAEARTSEEAPTERPAVFIAVGGAAARVLQKLRCRFAERLDAAPPDGVRLLAIDTDLAALRDGPTANERNLLTADETLHLPLRKPAEYRASSDEILSWLSRRWLYNIPRSLHTEGLRPLGRLAFVDHRQAIAGRLRDLLAGAPPRIFIVASIDGGAGGGMLLDLAYAVRQQLDELKLRTDCLCGLMLHGTLSQRTGNDLRNANAYATLTELNHFMRGGASFRSGPLEVLPAGDVSEPPFRDAYLVHLGSDLSNAELDTALGEVADYLYLNATLCAAVLDGFRQVSRAAGSDAAETVRLRSFGLHCRRLQKHGTAARLADRLCVRLVRTWLGESDKGPLSVTQMKPPELTLEDLAHRFQSIANQALGGSAEAHFRTLVAAPAGRPALLRDDDPAGPFGEELRRIHGVLGLPTGLEPSPSAPHSRLEATLAEGARKLAETTGDSLVASIIDIALKPQLHLPSALAGANVLQEHLRDLRQEAEETFRRGQSEATSLWSKLQRGELPRQGGWFSRLSAAQVDPEECLLDYCRLRLQTLVYKYVAALLQEILAKVTDLSQRLFKLRQSVQWLVADLEVTLADSRRADSEVQSGDSSLAAELEQFDAGDRLAEFGAALSRQLECEGGLLALADRGLDRWRELGQEMHLLIREAVLASLAQVDAGSVLLKQHSSPQKLTAAIGAALPRATARLHAAEISARYLMAIPQGPGHEAIAAAIAEHLPDAELMPSAEGDLVFLHEAAGISLAQAAANLIQDRDDCAEAARRVLTRLDVDWAALHECG